MTDRVTDTSILPASESPLSATWEIDDGNQHAPSNIKKLGGQNPQSLKSFWGGVAGLGLIATCASVAAVVVERVFEESLGNYMLRGIDANNTAANWAISLRWFDTQDLLLNSLAMLISGLAWLAIYPVLLWRGGLGRRFSIATPLFICICFLFDFIGNLHSHDILSNWIKIQSAVCVILCWGSLPFLIRLKAIHGSRLFQEFVCYAVLILAACVSIASMDQPSPAWVVAFICVYGLVILVASVLRNLSPRILWEAQSPLQISSRLSTATLITLTGIVAVFATALLMWTRSLMSYEIGAMVQSFVFLILVAGIGASIFLLVFELIRLPRLFHALSWIGLIILVTLTIHIGIGQSYRSTIRFNFSLGHYLFEVFTGFTATLVWWAIVKSCKAWLLYCGWRIGNPTEVTEGTSKLDF